MLYFLFCFWINLRSTALLSDCYLLEHVTGVSALLQRFGWDDQSHYFIASNKVTGDEVPVSPISQNRSRVVFLLNFGLASLLFLVNDGSDKPSKS